MVTAKEIIDATKHVLLVLFGSVGFALIGGVAGYLINEFVPSGIFVLLSAHSPNSLAMVQEELHMIACGAVIGFCLGLATISRR